MRDYPVSRKRSARSIAWLHARGALCPGDAVMNDVMARAAEKWDELTAARGRTLVSAGIPSNSKVDAQPSEPTFAKFSKAADYRRHASSFPVEEWKFVVDRVVVFDETLAQVSAAIDGFKGKQAEAVVLDRLRFGLRHLAREFGLLSTTSTRPARTRAWCAGHDQESLISAI